MKTLVTVEVDQATNKNITQSGLKRKGIVDISVESNQSLNNMPYSHHSTDQNGSGVERSDEELCKKLPDVMNSEGSQELLERSSVSSNEDTVNNFSSLLFISKRLNADNKSEIESSKNRYQSDKLTTSEIMDKSMLNIKEINLEDGIETMNSALAKPSSDDIFDVEDDATHKQVYLKALQTIYLMTVKEKLIVDSDNNISLSIDLEEESHRDLIKTLSKTKLSEILNLTIKNIDECDEDLESFLSQSLTTVTNFKFISSSYGVDVHDYMTGLLKIHYISKLNLKGFLIDNEDCEQLFSSTHIENLVLESGNLGIEEDFDIKQYQKLHHISQRSILKSIHLVDNEMDKKTMKVLLLAIKQSSISSSLQSLSLTECVGSVDVVRKIINGIDLSICIG